MYTFKSSFRAWGMVFVASALLVTAASSAVAGSWVALAPDGKVFPDTQAARESPRIVVDSRSDAGLEVTALVAGLEFSREKTKGGTFVWVSWPDAPVAGEIGGPALPVIRRLFIAPGNARVGITVNEGRASTVDMNAIGFTDPIMPMQPAIDMRPGALERAPFHFNKAAYASAESYPTQRVAVTELGIVRGHHLHLLEIRPLAYDPARGVLTVWPAITVRIDFQGGDAVGGSIRSMPTLSGVLLNPPPAAPAKRGSGNYLILVAQTFASLPQMIEFVSAKSAQGFNVMSTPIAAGTSNTEIKAYIESLWGTPDEPDYVLLVGDTNTIPHWIGQGDKASVTDLPYVCMDPGDDWYPDIPIGRFPVRSPEQLQVLVDKTLYIEAGDYSDPDFIRRAAFLAGLDGDCGDEETHNWVIDTHMLPNDYECNKVYMRTYGADIDDLRDAFNAGCGYGVYYGHSSSVHWYHFEFYQSDVRELTNTGMYPLVLSLSCNAGKYSNTECFGETWLIEADKGAVAFLATSNYIYYLDPPWHETANLEKFFFNAIYTDTIYEVSPAWQAALMYLLALYGPDDPVTRDYFEMFNLLGDPSLPAPLPPGFRLSANPASQSLCAPPTEQAEYTVDVDQIFGFDEPVTLATSGEPAGTSVAFSVNSVPPPFTTIMTVNNVDAASPGNYTIEITGTAPEMERSKSVELHVADIIPGEVVLTSPPDGETNVTRAPTLSWDPAVQAVEYDIEVATDPDFTTVVYIATESDTSHQVGVNLDTATLHYWHVQAQNGCGAGGYSPTFSFTTIESVDYVTEQFTPSDGDFDLDYRTVTFVPHAEGAYYTRCGSTASRLPTNPGFGMPLALADDGFIFVFPEEEVLLYGEPRIFFCVNANGNITFIDGDHAWDESLDVHFSAPRISALFDDLDPSAAGTVSWKATPDCIAVTWEAVPEYDTSNHNTFQIEMFFSGEIRITWLRVDSDDSIVGLSEGNGIPSDYLESDMSMVISCDACDMNCDGEVNGLDIGPFSLALVDPVQYGETYATCDIINGDLTGEGSVDEADIPGFVDLLLSAQPE